MLGLNDEMDSLMLREVELDVCMVCAGEKRSETRPLLRRVKLIRTR